MPVNNNNVRALRRLLKERGWVWDEIKDLPLSGLQAALSGRHSLEGWKRKEAKRLAKAAKKITPKTLLSKQGKPLKRVEGILSLPRFSEGSQGILIQSRVFIGAPPRKVLEKKTKEARALKEELEGLIDTLRELLPHQSVLGNTPQWAEASNGRFALNLAARKVLGSEGANCIGRYSGSSLIYEREVWGAFTQEGVTQWEHWKASCNKVTLVEAKCWDNALPVFPKGIAKKEEILDVLGKIDRPLRHPLCPEGWQCEEQCTCSWNRPPVEEELADCANRAHNVELLGIKAQKALADKVSFPNEEEEEVDCTQELWVAEWENGWEKKYFEFPGFLSFEEVCEEFLQLAAKDPTLCAGDDIREGHTLVFDCFYPHPRVRWKTIWRTSKSYGHHLQVTFSKKTDWNGRPFLLHGAPRYFVQDFPEMDLPQDMAETLRYRIFKEVLAHRPVMA